MIHVLFALNVLLLLGVIVGAWMLARAISWARYEMTNHKPSIFEQQQMREMASREKANSEPHTTWDASAARQARLN